MKKMLFSALCLSSTICGQEIKLYQFENGIPTSMKVNNLTTISISSEKHKDGEYSLKWDFKPGETLTIQGNVGYIMVKKNQQEKARSSYVMWIYNQTPINSVMQIQFKKDSVLKSYFFFNMNFTGWRTMWVQYDRDMQGTPEEGMNEIIFIAPKASGTVYIDHIMPAVLIDPRHNARDEQLDFINIEADKAANAHWMALYKNYNQIVKDNKNITLKSVELKGLKTIAQRYKRRLLKTVKTNESLVKEQEDLFAKYQNITLEFNQKLVIYKQFEKEQRDLFKYVLTRDFGIYLRNIAYMYNSTDNQRLKTRLAKLFNQSLEYMYDQGWTKGSAQGTVHHLGYQMREIYEAIFLMKDVLVKSKTVNKAKDMVTWYTAMGMLYTPQNEFKVNIDVLNTMLPGMLTAILLNEDKQQEVKELYLLQRYLNNSIQTSPGLLGGFKYDGTVFHHMQNYPAYAKGAFEGLLPIIFYLHKTPFAIKDENYNIVKRAVLFTRLYSNKYDYLLTLTGRHPNDKFNIDPEIFKLLALSSENSIDKELAEAYLRLNPKSRAAARLRKLGFRKEKTPEGSWTANMGSLQLHRRNEWLAGMKGYSRYLVGNETYVKNNLYGRYMSYGTFQILQDSLKNSGYVQEGWDWKHFPGTTAINVPFDKLKSSIAQVDTASGIEEMLLSDETYSGGNNLNGNSMFAMKLHEHTKYDGSHRARKSVFIFDNRAILLGTGIENNDTDNETHTTLFQNYLSPNTHSFTRDGKFILDSQQNLYKVVLGEVVTHKGIQKSFDQSTAKLTQNNYELAYINHGKKPHNSSYHYSILIKASLKEQENFKQNSQYKVINQDFHSHIVEDLNSNTIAYALFDEGYVAPNNFILSTDTPSLIMIQNKGEILQVSFVDPDLRLYKGQDPELYKNGEMIERSIYSRPWISNEGLSHTTTIIFKGKYSITENKNVKGQIEGENTKLLITSSLGKVINFQLNKNN